MLLSWCHLVPVVRSRCLFSTNAAASAAAAAAAAAAGTAAAPAASAAVSVVVVSLRSSLESPRQKGGSSSRLFVNEKLVTSHHPETDRLEAKQLRMCLLSIRELWY